jgi:very-short-patch-repair endonuclease
VEGGVDGGVVEVAGRGGEEARPRPVDERAIAAAASRQRGHVTTAQLRDSGLDDSATSKRVKRGRLHRRHRGVYAVGHTAKPRFADEDAAVRAAGERAFVSHYSAAVVWGMLPPRPNAPVHVTVCSPRAHRRGIRLHRTRRIAAEDVTRRYDLRVTTPARTLLDIAESEDQRTLGRAYNEALALALTTPHQIEALLDRSPGRRGAKRLRKLIDPHRGFTRNKAERMLKRATRHLPPAQHNVVVHGFEMDAWYRKQRVDVEIDGYTPHATPQKFDSDRRRDAELTARHGVRVLRFSWATLRDDPDEVAAQIAAALAATSPGTPRA